MTRLVLSLALLAPVASLRFPSLVPIKSADVRQLRFVAQPMHAALLAAAMATMLSATPPALAKPGDVAKLDLIMQEYAEVTCPEELASGRAGGALGAGAGGGGIAQKCVEVKVATKNDSGNELSGAGIFGRIEEVKSGMSVLGNGQDGKNDAGQFAMIDTIPKGESTVKFIFVAQQANDCVDKKFKNPETGKVEFIKCSLQGDDPLVQLKFEKLKAIAYPNAKQFKLYNECEQNEFAEGC